MSERCERTSERTSKRPSIPRVYFIYFLPKVDSPNRDPGGFARTEAGYLVLGRFDHSSGGASLHLNLSASNAIGLVSELRLRSLKPSKNWVILNEIHIEAFSNVSTQPHAPAPAPAPASSNDTGSAVLIVGLR